MLRKQLLSLTVELQAIYVNGALVSTQTVIYPDQLVVDRGFRLGRLFYSEIFSSPQSIYQQPTASQSPAPRSQVTSIRCSGDCPASRCTTFPYWKRIWIYCKISARNWIQVG